VAADRERLGRLRRAGFFTPAMLPVDAQRVLTKGWGFTENREVPGFLIDV
jgi:hypothetical protein